MFFFFNFYDDVYKKDSEIIEIPSSAKLTTEYAIANREQYKNERALEILQVLYYFEGFEFSNEEVGQVIDFKNRDVLSDKFKNDKDIDKNSYLISLLQAMVDRSEKKKNILFRSMNFL